MENNILVKQKIFREDVINIYQIAIIILMIIDIISQYIRQLENMELKILLLK